MAKWQDEFLLLLRNYYASQRARNPRYSMRALAQQLGTAPGPTSALIKGSKVWNISPEWALMVLEKMNLKPVQKNRLRVLLGEKPRLKMQKMTLIDEVEGSIVSHWAYWPVFVHFEMRPQIPDYSHIAQRLDIAVEDVTHIVEDLLRRGFLIKAEDDKLHRNSEALESSDDILSLAAKSMHRKSLEVAARAIERVPTSEREFQTLTVAGSRKVMDEVKAEIRTFTDKVAVLLNKEDENDQVYRFSIQLFPMNFGDFK